MDLCGFNLRQQHNLHCCWYHIIKAASLHQCRRNSEFNLPANFESFDLLRNFALSSIQLLKVFGAHSKYKLYRHDSVRVNQCRLVSGQSFSFIIILRSTFEATFGLSFEPEFSSMEDDALYWKRKRTEPNSEAACTNWNFRVHGEKKISSKVIARHLGKD